MSVAAPSPAPSLPALRRGLLAGFAYGGLLYGSVLSLLHVELNRLASVRDALITLVTFVLLYGLGLAACCLLGSTLAAFLDGRRRCTTERRWPRRGPLLGTLGFNLLYWELFFLYGLTYDQVPVSTLRGMLLWLAGEGLLIALVVTLASWLLFRLLAWLAGRGRLPALLTAAAAAAIVAHLVAPAWLHRHDAAPAAVQDTAPKAAPAAQEVQVEETGIKVAFVAFDGADWRVARPLMDAGQLPHIAQLVATGTSGPLATLPDANSAVIWASIYTGTTPQQHGVLDFYRIELPGFRGPGLYPVHRTYFKEIAEKLQGLELTRFTAVNRYSLNATPLWEIADFAGLSTGVVDGYFYSFPALEPRTPESFFLSYGLDDFARNLDAGKGSPRDIGLFVQPPDLFRRLHPLLDAGDFYWQSAALFDLLADHPQPRFLNFYTHQPDSFQHWYWRAFQPQYYPGGAGSESAEDAQRIPDLYRDFDAFLGRLSETLEPDTVLLVASDHGHAPTLVHQYDTQHRHGPPGILILRGGPIRPGFDLATAHVYDLFPTVLYLLGLPLPEDIAGQVLVDAIDADFLRQHPLRTIPAYHIPGLGGRLDPSLDGERNRQELEKLKSLGYI